VASESSIFRWFMSRHGDAVMDQNPGLLARLAQGAGACEVALVFRGDRLAAFAAWLDTAPAEAEILSVYATDPRVDPWEFVFGPEGPFAAAGVRRVWLFADRQSQARDLRKQGFRRASGEHAPRAATRLERQIGPPP
jgi:hypothetical protein